MSTRLTKSNSRKKRKKSTGTDKEYDLDFQLDNVPEPEDTSITMEISGPPDSGKTHFSLTFPKPLVLDTENKADIVINKFDKDIAWKVVQDFNDIRAGVYWAIENPDIETIVIDSSSEIRQLAEAEWLEENKKERVFPIILWGEVYEKVDQLTREIKDSGMNYVVTSRLKDEWIGENRTGRQIVDSYKKYPWDLKCAVRFVDGIRDTRDGKVHYKNRQFGKVIKNNFHGVDDTARITWQKPYIFDVSYEGVLKEMKQPWHGEDGVPLDNQIDQILKDVEEWIVAHG